MKRFLEYLLCGSTLNESERVQVTSAATEVYSPTDDTNMINVAIDQWFPLEVRRIKNALFKAIFKELFNLDLKLGTQYFADFAIDQQNENTIRITNSQGIVNSNRQYVIDAVIDALKASRSFHDVQRSGAAKGSLGNWIGIQSEQQTKSGSRIWVRLHIMASNSNSDTMRGSLMTEVLTTLFTHAYVSETPFSIQQLFKLTPSQLKEKLMDDDVKKVLTATTDGIAIVDEKAYKTVIDFLSFTSDVNYLSRKVEEGKMLGRRAIDFLKNSNILPQQVVDVHLSNSNKKSTTEDVAFQVRTDEGLKQYGFSCKAGGSKTGHAFKECRYSTLVMNHHILTDDEWNVLFNSIDADSFAHEIDIERYKVPDFTAMYEIPGQVYLKFIQMHKDDIFSTTPELQKLLLFMLSAHEDVGTNVIILNPYGDENTIAEQLISTLRSSDWKVEDTQPQATDVISVTLAGERRFTLKIRFGNGKLKQLVMHNKQGEFQFENSRSLNPAYLTGMSIKLNSIQ